MSAAGSGLLLPTLDELLAAGRARAGVTAVLDAADRMHADLKAGQVTRDDR